MKILYSILSAIFFIYTPIFATNPIGEWKFYSSYYETENVTESNNIVFALANNSLYSYDKRDNSIETYSKLNRLSDTDYINTIVFNKNTNSLLIVYSNGNIDILSEEKTRNISSLKSRTDIPDKSVNSIYIENDLAYLCLKSGILAIDMSKIVVKDYYKLEVDVFSVCIKDKYIYAATDNGLLKCSMDKNLLNKTNWENFTLSSNQIDEKNIDKIVLFKNNITYFIKSKGIFYTTNNGEIEILLSNNNLKDIDLLNNKLITYTDNIIYVYTDINDFYNIQSENIKDVSSFSENKYWIASGEKGLKCIQKRSKEDQQQILNEDITINSPKRNLSAFMTVNEEELFVVGGGRASDRFNLPGTLMTFKDNEWYNYDETEIANITQTKCADFTCVAVDPTDPKHYFVSSWGEGVYEFKNGKFIKLYTDEGTTLTSANSSKNYIRVDGVCFDENNNLWMTNSESEYGIKILTSEGKWEQLYFENLNKQYVIDKILITDDNQKWVNILNARDNVGILVFDDNGTIENTIDDDSYFFSKFYDQDDKLVDVTGYYSMAKDKNGAIWIGTSRGPIILNNPSRALALKENFRCSRIKIPYNDGSNDAYYFMDSEKVTSIAVDEGNRKWIGTESSGIYLVNEDGTEELHKFTTENSPLPSNNIQSIAINNKTGEVFIGTDKGIVSYQEIAIEGSDDYSDVYVYPNPVREDYNGIITITGLIEDSFVKITDLNGNLIFQGKSLGGQIGWNGYNSNGEFVKTGIYLVLAKEADGKESVVTKIMVIK